MTGRNDFCPCKSGKKFKKCCLNTLVAPRLNKFIKSSEEVTGTKRASKLAAKILASLDSFIKPGISTLEINDYVHQQTLKAGAESAPLGYVIDSGIPPFPKSICTSVNAVVAHGIPRADEILKEGDIINCDITVKLKGYHGDTSRTFIVGKVDRKIELLVQRTEQAMYEGIKVIKPGRAINSIGAAIEDFIKPFGYGIVKELTGHGVGSEFHSEPYIFHYRQSNYDPGIFAPNMIVTCEPMLNLGNSEITILDDKWTVITKDGSLSAQFEHTVLVTETGFEILTSPD